MWLLLAYTERYLEEIILWIKCGSFYTAYLSDAEYTRNYLHLYPQSELKKWTEAKDICSSILFMVLRVFLSFTLIARGKSVGFMNTYAMWLSIIVE